MSCCKALRRAALALALTALAGAACQPVQRPFEGTNADNPLLAPRTVAGVLVRPIDGMEDGAGLAEAMAEALRQEEIPAHVNAANRVSYTLAARARTEWGGPQGRGAHIVFDWYLTDAGGQLAGDHRQVTRVPADWPAPDEGYLRRTAAAAAPVFARLIAGRDAETPIVPPKMTVHAVDGAPGDGRISLARALGFELEKAGYKVVQTLEEDAIALLGAVRLTPAGTDGQKIAISWTALAPTGEEIGTVSQENVIPKGALDGPWGTTAVLAARAAVPGITQLMTRARRRNLAGTGAAGKVPDRRP